MLLRIALIVTILAGAGGIAVSYFKVKPHLETIIEARNDFGNKYTNTLRRATVAEKNLKETQGKLANTEKQLKDTEIALTASRTQAENEQKRANKLKSDLDKTAAELKTAQQDLASWNALSMPVDKVVEALKTLKQTQEAFIGLEGENKTFVRRIKELEGKLATLVGDDKPVILPTGLKGKVLVVDPKYDFVVLNIGQNQGVLPNGIMMVSRESKLVAKVRISSVQSERCVANIMPGWKLDEVMEGDIVIY